MSRRSLTVLGAVALLFGALAGWWVSGRGGSTASASASAGAAVAPSAAASVSPSPRPATPTHRPAATTRPAAPALSSAPLPVPPVAPLPPLAGPRYTVPPVPGPAAGGPGPVALRLNVANNSPELIAPGLAVYRGTVQASAVTPVSFDSAPLQRPVTVDGGSTLRLHLTHSASGDVALQLTLLDVRSDGSTTTLADVAATVPAAVAAAGPYSDADVALPTGRATLPTGDMLRLTVGLPAASFDTVTLYYGALPGQDTSNSTNDQLQQADGGPDPARLTVPVTQTSGAFQPY